MLKWTISILLLLGVYQNCGFQGNFNGFESPSYITSYNSDLELSSALPDRGFASGGQIITLHGESFVPDMEAFIDGKPCLNLNLLSESEAVCLTPSGLKIGDATISVKRGQVIRELLQSFKVDTELKFLSVIPASGTENGNTQITLMEPDLIKILMLSSMASIVVI